MNSKYWIQVYNKAPIKFQKCTRARFGCTLTPTYKCNVLLANAVSVPRQTMSITGTYVLRTTKDLDNKPTTEFQFCKIILESSKKHTFKIINDNLNLRIHHHLWNQMFYLHGRGQIVILIAFKCANNCTSAWDWLVEMQI